MRLIMVPAAILLALSAARAAGDVVSERLGGPSGSSAHPKAVKIQDAGGVTQVVFDLAAIPTGVAIHRASLAPSGRVAQPREPIRIVAVKAIEGGKVVPAGEPLALAAPYFRSFDATEVVKAWAADPKSNLGLALLSAGGLDAKDLYLDLWYEGKPAKVTSQVEGLQARHANGQTFLVWKELAEFRPAPDKVVWTERFDYRNAQRAEGPGTNQWGGPRLGAVTLATLRDLEGFAVRTEPGPGQRLADQKRIRQVPDVEYRIYRSRQRITAGNIGGAELAGSARRLNAYDTSMLMGAHIDCRGEYYQQKEIPDSLFKTWTLADGRAVAPGEAFFVFTPIEGQSGRYYYAVTAWKNGVENLQEVSEANSLAEPLEEQVAVPKPVLQHARKSTVFGRPKEPVTEYWYAYFLAPPLANVPQSQPLRLVVVVPEDWKAPGSMHMSTSAGGAFWGTTSRQSGKVWILVEEDVAYGGGLGYNEGRGTLKAFRGSSVRLYSEKYLFTALDWAMGKWPSQPGRFTGAPSVHFAARHPEIFRVLIMGGPWQTEDGYAMDFDQKWNPGSGSLLGRLGPPDLVEGPNGGPAWDMYDLTRYLLDNPDRDIPFLGCMFNQPKDGNHGAEYGWQDDPKGYAALREARQPYSATWGGAGLPREVAQAYVTMRWDTTIPAFSNCTLDNNPGTGDPDAGEPWGQINTYLLWDPDSAVDEPGRWEMTVWQVSESPEESCLVDITPRHCEKFKPKPGEQFRWENKDLATGKMIASDKVTADKWGLVTLKQIAVTKGRNRIVIRK